jgi:hypothetical protein
VDNERPYSFVDLYPGIGGVFTLIFGTKILSLGGKTIPSSWLQNCSKG